MHEPSPGWRACLLFGEFTGEPVEPLVKTLALAGASGLDIPLQDGRRGGEGWGEALVSILLYDSAKYTI